MSLETRNWAAAAKVIRNWEASRKIGEEPPDIPTIKKAAEACAEEQWACW